MNNSTGNRDSGRGRHDASGLTGVGVRIGLGRLMQAAVFAALAVVIGCGDDDGGGESAAAGEIACLRLEIPTIVSAPDPDCVMFDNPLAAEYLPDLSAPEAPGSCGVLQPADGVLSNDSGLSLNVVYRSEFAVDSPNLFGTPGIAPLPVPLFDGDGAPGIYVPFTAADVTEIWEASSGEMLGELVVRNAGWLQVDPEIGAPFFLTERQAITRGTGRLLQGVVGQVTIDGDAFVTGASVTASICGAGLGDRFAEVAG